MLLIEERAWLLMQAAVNFKPGREVAGFGKVVYDAEHDQLVVSDVLIPPQEVGMAHAEFDVDRGDLDWLALEVIKKGDQPKDWRLWWHSHGNLGVSPSGTDHNTLKVLARMYAERGSEPWAVGLVLGTGLAAHGWLAYKHPMFNEYEDGIIPVTYMAVQYPDLAAQVALWMEHVKEPPPKSMRQQGTTGAAGVSKFKPTPTKSAKEEADDEYFQGLTTNQRRILEMDDGEYDAWLQGHGGSGWNDIDDDEFELEDARPASVTGALDGYDFE